ncbi:ankyrin repeat domain-containing protein [Candidatus Dependentiae bacterium]|nr:ankyrin repeat domain-containing protein [Candidatus Dependentiae bacterium]
MAIRSKLLASGLFCISIFAGGSPFSDDDIFLEAVRRGSTNLIQQIITMELPISPAARNASLWQAVSDNNVAMVLYLLRLSPRYRPDIHADKNKALIDASTKGYREVVQCLVCHGADIHARNNHAVMTAAANGYLAVVRYLVEQGANVHAKDDRDHLPDAPLLLAVINGHIDVVQYLLALSGNQRPDIHVDDDRALFWAARKGHLNIVRLLMRYNANIYARQCGALQVAVQYNHAEVVRYLLTLLARSHLADNPTPYNNFFCMAAARGNEAIMQLLLDNGADINTRNGLALLEAVRSGNLAIVQYLVARGAHVNADNNHALRSAIRRGYVDIANYLLHAGADQTMLTPEEVEILTTIFQATIPARCKKLVAERINGLLVGDDKENERVTLSLAVGQELLQLQQQGQELTVELINATIERLAATNFMQKNQQQLQERAQKLAAEIPVVASTIVQVGLDPQKPYLMTENSFQRWVITENKAECPLGTKVKLSTKKQLVIDYAVFLKYYMKPKLSKNRELLDFEIPLAGVPDYMFYDAAEGSFLINRIEAIQCINLWATGYCLATNPSAALQELQEYALSQAQEASSSTADTVLYRADDLRIAVIDALQRNGDSDKEEQPIRRKRDQGDL